MHSTFCSAFCPRVSQNAKDCFKGKPFLKNRDAFAH